MNHCMPGFSPSGLECLCYVKIYFFTKALRLFELYLSLNPGPDIHLDYIVWSLGSSDYSVVGLLQTVLNTTLGIHAASTQYAVSLICYNEELNLNKNRLH